MLVLLVESGAAYCLLWALVAAYALSSALGRAPVQVNAPGWAALAFYLANGCLISLVVSAFRAESLGGRTRLTAWAWRRYTQW